MVEGQINRYISIHKALEIHDKEIISGGLSGVRDIKQLKSILIWIQDDFYYPDFIDKLTHLFYSIIKFHVFWDGNKRTAISLGAYFLNKNDLGKISSIFMKEMKEVSVKVAEGSISKEKLKDIIQEVIEKR